MTNISQKGYVATPAQIGELTTNILNATATADSGFSTYLRALVATTQKELGAPQRLHRTKEQAMTEESTDAQLAALEAVHTRFYEAVVAAASATVPRGVELNGRTNFARSSVSTVRTWLKAGHDITSIVPGKLTKSMLYVEAQPRALSARRLVTRVERTSKALVTAVLALAETDPETAAQELELVLAQLQAQLTEIAVAPTQPPERPPKEPTQTQVLRSRGFIPPTQTQVLRQRARPS